MTPTAAYRRLNVLLWNGRLPKPTIQFVDGDTIPNCYGITLFDRDFARPVIFLNRENKHWGKTLLHEMLHVAEPLLPHGPVFELLVKRYWKLGTTNVKGLRNQ